MTITQDEIIFLIDAAIEAVEYYDDIPRDERNKRMNNLLNALRTQALCQVVADDPNCTDCTCTAHTRFNRLTWLLNQD